MRIGASFGIGAVAADGLFEVNSRVRVGASRVIQDFGALDGVRRLAGRDS
jgi:hypothetical protein